MFSFIYNQEYAKEKENTTLNSELPLLHTHSPPHSWQITVLMKWEWDSCPLLQWGPCRVGLVVLKSWSMGWGPRPGRANTHTKQRGIQTQGAPTSNGTVGPGQAGWIPATGPRSHDGWGETHHESRRDLPSASAGSVDDSLDQEVSQSVSPEEANPRERRTINSDGGN